MSHSNCQCEQIVSSPIGQVTVCSGCGQVHLTMQCMTVRFELDAFRMLAAMLGQAQQQIDCALMASVSAPRAVRDLH